MDNNNNNNNNTPEQKPSKNGSLLKTLGIVVILGIIGFIFLLLFAPSLFSGSQPTTISSSEFREKYLTWDNDDANAVTNTASVAISNPGAVTYYQNDSEIIVHLSGRFEFATSTDGVNWTPTGMIQSINEMAIFSATGDSDILGINGNGSDGIANQIYFERTNLVSEQGGARGENITADTTPYAVTQIQTPASSNTAQVLLQLLISILPFALLVIVGIWLFTKFFKGRPELNVGQNKAKLTNSDTRFTDVAGIIDEKLELEELVDYLKYPQKYISMGVKIPKGILLVGPPGTGKTLLARAVAGEANVPFFSISASEFVEMFVGVGASRVRNMFKTARKSSPSIIFIDELDAIGRQRGTGLGGGNDEREQTLNQILVEMDGFGTGTGVIIIAATNRPDVLDPALLRPGRFDRQIQIGLPDVKERESILKIHARNKNISPKVDFQNVARRTPGFSGAQLANTLNEAALMAVRNKLNYINSECVDEAIDRVIGGPAKLARVYNPYEKKLVAYHEAGHALIGVLLEDAHEVQKVTIIPRGQAGGYTLMTPKEETFLQSKKQLYATITGYLGGRAAEEIIFGDPEITTGATSDITTATTIARKMVTELGMSSLGLVKYEKDGDDPFVGRSLGSSRNFSGQTANEIDKEVKKIMDTCFEKAKDLISKNKKLLSLMAESLIKLETINSEQIRYIYKNKKLPPETKNVKLTREEKIAMVSKGKMAHSEIKTKKTSDTISIKPNFEDEEPKK